MAQRTVVGRVVAVGTEYIGENTPGIPDGYEVPAPWKDENAKYWIALSLVHDTDPSDWVDRWYQGDNTLKEIFEGRPSRVYVVPKPAKTQTEKEEVKVDFFTLTMTDAERAMLRICLEDRHQRTRTPGELRMIRDILQRL